VVEESGCAVRICNPAPRPCWCALQRTQRRRPPAGGAPTRPATETQARAGAQAAPCGGAACFGCAAGSLCGGCRGATSLRTLERGRTGGTRRAAAARHRSSCFRHSRSSRSAARSASPSRSTPAHASTRLVLSSLSMARCRSTSGSAPPGGPGMPAAAARAAGAGGGAAAAGAASPAASGWAGGAAPAAGAPSPVLRLRWHQPGAGPAAGCSRSRDAASCAARLAAAFLARLLRAASRLRARAPGVSTCRLAQASLAAGDVNTPGHPRHGPVVAGGVPVCEKGARAGTQTKSRLHTLRARRALAYPKRCHVPSIALWHGLWPLLDALPRQWRRHPAACLGRGPRPQGGSLLK